VITAAERPLVVGGRGRRPAGAWVARPRAGL